MMVVEWQEYTRLGARGGWLKKDALYLQQASAIVPRCYTQEERDTQLVLTPRALATRLFKHNSVGLRGCLRPLVEFGLSVSFPRLSKRLWDGQLLRRYVCSNSPFGFCILMTTIRIGFIEGHSRTEGTGMLKAAAV